MWPKGLRTGENWTAARALCPLGAPILLMGSLPLPHAPCPDAHLAGAWFPLRSLSPRAVPRRSPELPPWYQGGFPVGRGVF